VVDDVGVETDLPNALGPRIGPLTTRRPGPPESADARRERAEARAWLHDRVLQLLEYIAAGGYEDEPDVDHLRRVAALGADELRAFVEGPLGPGGDLVEALTGVVAETQLLSRDLAVELVTGRLAFEPEPAVVDALAAATREALTNVRRHAGATRAIVTCTATPELIRVAIKDDGTGFDLAETDPGVGLRHSIVGRLLSVGGCARLEPSEGTGTIVTLTIRPGA
jgi:signal transduction histidine kinase